MMTRCNWRLKNLVQVRLRQRLSIRFLRCEIPSVCGYSRLVPDGDGEEYARRALCAELTTESGRVAVSGVRHSDGEQGSVQHSSRRCDADSEHGSKPGDFPAAEYGGEG